MQRLGTLATLAGTSLRDDRGRAAYLIVTLAITTAAWPLVAAITAPSLSGIKDTSGFGITLRNGSQTSSHLPLRYASRIEAIPGARDVFWYGLNPVKCSTATMVVLYANGGPGRGVYLAQQKAPAAMIRRWDADPLGAVISKAAATKRGWLVGQGVAPPSGMQGNGPPVSLHILGIVPGAHPSAQVHYEYLNRIAPGLQGRNNVVTYFTSAADPRDNDLLAARIEAAFAQDFPTISATTNATTQDAWARFGRVQQLLGFVMAALLLCAASVLVSVLVHAAIERRGRFALLQVLGFRRATLFGAFALDVLATVVIGALLGIGLAAVARHGLARTAVWYLSGGLRIPAWAWWILPAWLAVLFVAALVAPATLIARVRPADCRER